MHAVIIIVLILAILLVIFTLQNSFEVTINVFFWEISNAPLVLVLIVCLVLGYLLASIYFYPQIWRLSKENKRFSKLNKNLEKQLGTDETEDDTGPEGIELDVETDDEDKSFFRE
ncbi:MAG: LapA family protein [Bacteroidales bacterium]|jgi:uncharacterized integral membrane protein|nr:LapA family protein [Bacteroidales bacterium]